MKYDTITIDSEVVEHNGFHFDSGLLDKLKQFKEGPIEVVVSSVIINELVRRLSEKTREAKEFLTSALRKASDYGIIEPDTPILDQNSDPKEIAKNRLISFLIDIGAQSIRVDKVSTRDVLKLYFAPAPPFSASGKKKHEFPDAIALLSLEEWAESNDKKILAVTKDSDWKAFAANSSRIDVIEDLANALALFQEHAEEAERIAQVVLKGIFTNKYIILAESLSDLLADEISGYPIEAQAESYLHVEGEEVQLELIEYEPSGNEDEYEFTLVQAGPTKIAIQILFSAKVKASASFSFSVHDSTDDDYVGMGSAQSETEDEIDITTLITFVGDFEKEIENNIKISSLEVIKGPYFIDFGKVDPDYGDDYYDDEPQYA